MEPRISSSSAVDCLPKRLRSLPLQADTSRAAEPKHIAQFTLPVQRRATGKVAWTWAETGYPLIRTLLFFSSLLGVLRTLNKGKKF